jgi:phage terminase large subunit GpA-like protein
MERITHLSARTKFLAVILECFAAFRPPRDITISEWAIENRILPKGTSARPGPFRPEVFQIEMMDVVRDPLVRKVVVMKSTQVGFSDAVLNNVIGYYIAADPHPMMMVQPTQDNAKDYGKKRITPMLDSSPVLRERIRPSTSSKRRAGNTLDLKEFPGGFLKLAGANSGAGLRSDPLAIVIFDEIDAYPLDVDGEGDPIAIGERRTDSYEDHKILKGSTPAKPTGISPIEKEYEKSDQRLFHVPCPFCEKLLVLWWRDPETKEYRLTYEFDKDNQLVPGSVAYICPHCKARISENFKQQMLNRGKWIATFPGRPVVGFHINALYSPWRSTVWNDLAIEWKEAQRDPEKLRAFINLRLGQTFEEDGSALETSALKSRRHSYGKDAEGEDVQVPHGVGLLTAAVDVQGDRLECVVKGWGEKEESWLIAYEQKFGDPGRQTVWDELDDFLRSTFWHASGARLTIKATMIDSGGSNTEDVYRFVKPRQGRRIWACKGTSEAGKEILGRYAMNNSYGVKLWSLGVDTAKDRIFARLKIPSPGPAYAHLPDWIDEEYLEQLTSERAIRKYKRGKGMVREYVKTRSRNEALDLEVYALAALYSLGKQIIPELKSRAKSLSEGKDDALFSPATAAKGRRTLHQGIT